MGRIVAKYEHVQGYWACDTIHSRSLGSRAIYFSGVIGFIGVIYFGSFVSSIGFIGCTYYLSDLKRDF